MIILTALQNTIKLTLQIGSRMKKLGFQQEVCDDHDELTRSKVPHTFGERDPIIIKPLARFNRAKFPCDFFSAIRPRQISSRLEPLPVESCKENALVTPRFSSLQSRIPQLLLSKLKDEKSTAEDQTTLASFVSQRNTSREYGLSGEGPHLQSRTVTAKDMCSSEQDNKMCNHLRDIIKLTTSVKKVCRKHSLDIRRTVNEQQNQNSQFASIELPRLVIPRRANLSAGQPTNQVI